MGERLRELLILITGDVFVFNFALWCTLLVRYFEVPSVALLKLHLPPFLTLTAIWVLVFFALGLYDKHTNLLKRLLATRIFYAQTINVVVAGILFFFLPFGITPKTNLLIFLVISISLLSLPTETLIKDKSFLLI